MNRKNKKNRSLKQNEKGMELPINIVVMLVVGMVALAALLSIIPESKKNLIVEVESIGNNNNLRQGVTTNITHGVDEHVQINLKVYDNDNNPVQGADVIISGGGGQGSEKTDINGEAEVEVNNVNIRFNQDSLDLKLIVKANGFYEYRDESAILIT
ncbi:MAG: carboxypeptidase regulatory-like domain-containing protein [Methanosarcinales archaeon]